MVTIVESTLQTLSLIWLPLDLRTNQSTTDQPKKHFAPPLSWCRAKAAMTKKPTQPSKRPTKESPHPPTKESPHPQQRMQQIRRNEANQNNIWIVRSNAIVWSGASVADEHSLCQNTKAKLSILEFYIQLVSVWCHSAETNKPERRKAPGKLLVKPK